MNLLADFIISFFEVPSLQRINMTVRMIHFSNVFNLFTATKYVFVHAFLVMFALGVTRNRSILSQFGRVYKLIV